VLINIAKVFVTAPILWTTVRRRIGTSKRKIKNWKERTNKRADWEKSIKEARVLIGLKCNLRKKKKKRGGGGTAREIVKYSCNDPEKGKET
jgi:hypothetical protein